MSWNRTQARKQTPSPRLATAARKPAALAAPELAAVGWFVLRTPLLPFEELVAWSDGVEAPAALGDGSPDRPLEEAVARD